MLRPQAKAIDLNGKPDLKDPDLYLHEQHHEAFRRLRAEEPVYWNPEADGPGFWAVTRYDDIEAVSKNPKLFSSAKHNGGHRIFNENEIGGNDTDASMISMDPPAHAGYRRMVTPGFVPKRISNMEERIRARVTRLLDAMPKTGEAEFISAVAAALPIEVLAELFGVPESDGPKLFEWSNATVGEDDPELRVSDEYMQKCIMEMAGYAAGLWQQRLETPGDDLISMLAHSKIGGEAMNFPTYIGTFILLVVAGNETTRNSISGGLLALSENPGERQKLLDDPSLIPSAVQEIVRWVSPVLHMRRTATEDTELRGQKIRKGDKVVMWYASGNRDEAQWADPYRFDVARYAAPGVPAQIGFGVGQHFCLGSRLAELQLTILFEELLRRFPDINVSGPIRRLRSNFIYGIKEMPVSYTPEG
ncbi:cytochrome P450 [Parvibaculum lavamentivorans DS-1]|uniref:Cytochrome P450 n=1 Tax=Parvibaculum lavamentivorans (strain DS-1 / DSM 13023 / NCIMB 13966) TaxID=402881 RepID=A7HP19_PARL1|nr:cytochrome P450 [Parvibaculum lavamentivorans]ABS61652.1 cytochrome P450 [Parvibaculum lavamentivorans DS-1]